MNAAQGPTKYTGPEKLPHCCKPNNQKFFSQTTLGSLAACGSEIYNELYVSYICLLCLSPKMYLPVRRTDEGDVDVYLCVRCSSL